MTQKKIKWEFDNDSQELTGKIGIFKFNVVVVFEFWRATLIEPFRLNYDSRGNWSNSPAAQCLNKSSAKKICKGYISDILSELTEEV
jgi:hypothetical protein